MTPVAHARRRDTHHVVPDVEVVPHVDDARGGARRSGGEARTFAGTTFDERKKFLRNSNDRDKDVISRGVGGRWTAAAGVDDGRPTVGGRVVLDNRRRGGRRRSLRAAHLRGLAEAVPVRRGRGLSRLALECRARPTAKLRAVFLSSFRPRASGGLGGLLLRLCADGHKSVCLAGPPGVGTHVEGLRDFVRFRHPEVTALRLVPPGLTRQDVFAPDDTRACDAAAESYRDDAVMVFPLFAPSGAGPDAFETCRVCAAVDEASSDEASSDEASSDGELGRASGFAVRFRSASDERTRTRTRTSRLPLASPLRNACGPMKPRRRPMSDRGATSSATRARFAKKTSSRRRF